MLVTITPKLCLQTSDINAMQTCHISLKSYAHLELLKFVLMTLACLCGQIKEAHRKCL